MIEKKQNIIILFRGSSVDRSFIHKNELISSISCELKKINSNYHIIDFPGPGCDNHLNKQNKNDYNFKLTPCKKNPKYMLARAFGVIGPSNMNFNVKQAYKKIINILKKDDIKQLIFIGHSRGAIQAFMLSNLIFKQDNNDKLKNLNINIIALDPVSGPVTPKNSKHLNSNVKNLDIFIASECRVPFMTSIIPKIYKNTKNNIKHLPTNHNGIVNLKCSREEKGWRSVEAKTAKHVSKYLKIYILNKIIDLNIKIPDSNLIKDKFKKISFPKVTDKEKKILQKEGISKTFKFYRKKNY